ncbi:MAG: type II toxin-antitoxin system RelE/ParE family toxin [Candidatus Electrothrix sp. AU1_5]|jgi:mRNA interferase RelE/StbE|nr:type II toxin-antitoxin system RelE/ParE family toxin [Candidatus Electrothrix sp. AR5]MCI5163665.1 type II toxin-antitoxin system RelE/ParE family toxin [Candidatus Electrothrix sp. AX5]MCI5192796.1 type II toxin-antitoxin system RelE/ParE family toxin [Candidatus Electrothrix gigas]
MKINIRKSAIKDLKKISLNDRQKIHSKILILSKFPNISNVKKLTNFEPAYRLRVGNYRILFDVSETTIEIGRVLHRKDSYK